MKRVRQAILVSCLSLILGANSTAEEALMIDNFEAQPELRWRYFSDQVMGGVSQGKVNFATEQGEQFAHLTGEVSTANNGGFIQVRREIAKASIESAAGVYLRVRGNGEPYYLHLRTSGTLLPWQYYQASFQTTQQWQIIKVPLSAFARSSSWISKSVKPRSLSSIAIVAFGREHSADIEIAQIGFY
jgi:hypothetical protein